MKHSIVLPLLGLLSVAAVNAATPKVGTVGPVTLQATLVTQAVSAPVNSGSVSKQTYTQVTSRYSNREILARMAVGSAAIPNTTPAVPKIDPLLDGSVAGWSLARVTDASGAGKVYAIKNGKAAVAVPAAILVQPVVTGEAIAGTVTTTVVNSVANYTFAVNSKAYGTAGLLNGTAIVSGTETRKTGAFKSGTTTTPVLLRTENYALVGQQGSITNVTLAPGTINASFRITRATAADISVLIPGSATP